MVAFLPTVYEGQPPSFGEQSVNTRARGCSGTNFFESAADDRYMPAHQHLITLGKVQIKADAAASIAAGVQGKEPIHVRATK